MTVRGGRYVAPGLRRASVGVGLTFGVSLWSAAGCGGAPPAPTEEAGGEAAAEPDGAAAAPDAAAAAPQVPVHDPRCPAPGGGVAWTVSYAIDGEPDSFLRIVSRTGDLVPTGPAVSATQGASIAEAAAGSADTSRLPAAGDDPGGAAPGAVDADAAAPAAALAAAVEVVLAYELRDMSGRETGQQRLLCDADGLWLARTGSVDMPLVFEPPLLLVPFDTAAHASSGDVVVGVDGVTPGRYAHAATAEAAPAPARLRGDAQVGAMRAFTSHAELRVDLADSAVGWIAEATWIVDGAAVFPVVRATSVLGGATRVDRAEFVARSAPPPEDTTP